MTQLTEKETAELVRAAAAFRERAYARYSGFQVGAALLSGDGRIFGGCNVENASYGLTICAERGAIAAAVAAGERDFRAIAIVGGSGKPATPCGACRQFLVEFNPLMKVILATPGNPEMRVYDARDLLPEFFTLKD